MSCTGLKLYAHAAQPLGLGLCVRARSAFAQVCTKSLCIEYHIGFAGLFGSMHKMHKITCA
jgi:hypothetical protein